MYFNAMNNQSSVLVSLTALFLGGCCCCGGTFSPPTIRSNDGFSSDGVADGPVDGDFDGSSDGDVLSPNAEKEMQDARSYAQKALNAKGFGEVRSVNLQKDGTNWYATGTAAGLDGGDVSYNVWFIVTSFENNNQVKTTWAVKTVTVDGEVVYP